MALALLMIVGCEQHFWADDEVIEQTSTISINPKDGDPVYEYTIYTDMRALMTWGTTSSISSYNRIYSYTDNSTRENGVVTKYDIEFVESRYDANGVETQYTYEISQKVAKSAATIAPDSVQMVVTNITDNLVVASISSAQFSLTSRAVSESDLASGSVTDFNPTAEVTLEQRRFTMDKGTTQTLVASVGGSEVSGNTLSWSSDNTDFVTVDANGEVTAVAEGSANITASSKSGDYKALCTISVVEMVESITITPESYDELIYGKVVDADLATFSVELDKLLPEDATIKAIEWKSSDETIATVSADGLVTAVNAGEVEIYAASTDGSGVESNRCKVTIKAANEVTNIVISGAPTEDIMEKGDTAELSATVTPDDATNSDITWSSSAPEIISVTAEGEIEALKDGKATITATAKDGSGISDSTAEITVVIPIKTITLSNYSTELEIEESETITATLDPINTTDAAVTWSSSVPSVASIVDGLVTALTAGETTISITSDVDSDITASYTLTVVPKTTKVSSVELCADKIIDISKSTTAIITATVSDDADNRTLKWESSDETIATVSDNGEVAALKAGEVTITATSTDGSNISDTCTIKFCSAEIPETLNASISEWDTSIINTTQITLTSEFCSLTPTNVSWASETESVATVSDTGVITPKSLGTTTITYKATVGGIEIEDTCEVSVLVKSFPDATFVTLLQKKQSTLTSEKGGGILLTDANQTALNKITSLVNDDTKGVADATGIAYLTILNSFTAQSNFRPETLDLSKNTALKSISFTGNMGTSVLTSITLGKLTSLTSLALTAHSNLTTVDISGCSSLETVNLNNSGVTEIICTKAQKPEDGTAGDVKFNNVKADVTYTYVD